MSTFELQTKSLSEQVYEHLTNRIIDGSLEYGQTLNIKEIAAGLNVSAMPVREAIKRLEFEGVVAIHPRSRCVLRMPTRESILAAVDMRQTIESYCIEAILHAQTLPSLRGLEQLLEQMESVVGSKTGERERLRRYIDLDRRFHSELCRLSGNQYAVKFHRELYLHLNMTYIYGLGSPPNLGETFNQHRRIVEHLSRRDAAAPRLLEQHLAASRRNIISGPVLETLQ